VEVPPHSLHDLAMTQWTEVMRKLGGGRVTTPYNDVFFHWWQQKIIAIDDYPCEGINYQGDRDMPLPLYLSLGRLVRILSFVYFNFFFYFFLFDKYKTKTKIFLAWHHILTFIPLMKM
jgi:hypothetical protein